MLPKFDEWETKNQSHLKKLLSLMHIIKEAAKATKDERCIVIWSGTKPPFKLEVYEAGRDNFVVSRDVRENGKLLARVRLIVQSE